VEEIESHFEGLIEDEQPELDLEEMREELEAIKKPPKKPSVKPQKKPSAKPVETFPEGPKLEAQKKEIYDTFTKCIESLQA
jgi:hypothetical protein